MPGAGRLRTVSPLDQRFSFSRRQWKQVEMEAKNDTPEQVFPSIYGTAADRAHNQIVTVLVEGNPVLAVIGTAAQVTVVNARTAQEWVRGKESTPSFLRGIGERPVPAGR